MSADKPVYLVDGARTPFLIQPFEKQRYSALDMAMVVARTLLLQQPFPISEVDSIVLANTLCDNHHDIAYQLAQRLHCNKQTSMLVKIGETAGLQALHYARQQITLHGKQLVLVGGSDVLSNASENQESQLDTMLGSVQSMAAGLKISAKHFDFLKQASSEYPAQKSYYEAAEKLAIKLDIPIKRMAEYVQLSQRRLQYAQRNNLIASLSPLFYADGRVINRDEGIIHLPAVTASKKPASDTLVNPLILPQDSMAKASEGATMLLLASEEAVKKYQLDVLAILPDSVWMVSDTTDAEKASVNGAVGRLLAAAKLTLDDIDYWECNELSAVSLLAIQQQCNAHEKLTSLSHVNIDGGALALGNPPAANMMRMVLQLAHILKRNKAHQGIVTSVTADGREYALLVGADHE